MARPRWVRCQSPKEAGVHETSFTHLGETQVNSVLFRLRRHSHDCWRRHIKHSARSVNLKTVRHEQINLPIWLTQSERGTVRRCNIIYNLTSSSAIKAFFPCGFCTVTDALSLLYKHPHGAQDGQLQGGLHARPHDWLCVVWEGVFLHLCGLWHGPERELKGNSVMVEFYSRPQSPQCRFRTSCRI